MTQTINDVVMEVGQRFGLTPDAELNNAVRLCITTSYSDVEINDDFLSLVWKTWKPNEKYPF